MLGRAGRPFFEINDGQCLYKSQRFGTTSAKSLVGYGIGQEAGIVRQEVCDQLISECEQTCQKMGVDFYQVMTGAPRVVEKLKGYAALFQQFWEHAGNREELAAFLLTTGPDLEPTELETVRALIRTLPYLLRGHLQGVAKRFPPSPGGRPPGLSPEQSRAVCQQIGTLFGQGVRLPDAQKRMARRHGVSLRTIQRAWRERAKWKCDPV